MPVLTQALQYQFARGRIGRQRHIVYVANAHQHLDVWFMGMLAQRVAEENDGIDFALGGQCSDLGIAAFRAAEFQLNIQARLSDIRPGGARSDKLYTA